MSHDLPTTDSHDRRPQPTAPGRRRFSLMAVAVLIVGIGLWKWPLLARTMSSQTTEPMVQSGIGGKPVQNPAMAPGGEGAVEIAPQHLVGKWRLDRSIQREIDIHADGTAVMKCKLDFLSSLVYGSELVLNLKWTLENGLLTHTVTSGVPQQNVEKLTSTFGNSMTYRVMQADAQSLVLQGPLDSKDLENWTAVQP